MQQERPLLQASLDFEELPEALGSLRMAELGERLGLDLTDTFAGDAELLTDFLERLGSSAVEAETQPHDLLLAVGQLSEHLGHGVVQHHPRRRVGRAVDRLVLDEVTEVGLVLVADRRIERQRVLRVAQQLTHTIRLQLHLLGDLVDGRFPLEFLVHLPFGAASRGSCARPCAPGS